MNMRAVLAGMAYGLAGGAASSLTGDPVSMNTWTRWRWDAEYSRDQKYSAYHGTLSKEQAQKKLAWYGSSLYHFAVLQPRVCFCGWFGDTAGACYGDPHIPAPRGCGHRHLEWPLVTLPLPK